MLARNPWRASLLVSDTHAFSLGGSDFEVCPKDSRFDRSFFWARLSDSGPEQNDPANRKQYQQKAISSNCCYYRFSCKLFQSIHWYSTPGVVVFYYLRRFDRWAIFTQSYPMSSILCVVHNSIQYYTGPDLYRFSKNNITVGIFFVLINNDRLPGQFFMFFNILSYTYSNSHNSQNNDVFKVFYRSPVYCHIISCLQLFQEKIFFLKALNHLSLTVSISNH